MPERLIDAEPDLGPGRHGQRGRVKGHAGRPSAITSHVRAIDCLQRCIRVVRSSDVLP